MLLFIVMSVCVSVEKIMAQPTLEDHDLSEIMDTILAILHLAGSIKDVSPQHRYDIVQSPIPSFLLLFFELYATLLNQYLLTISKTPFL